MGRKPCCTKGVNRGAWSLQEDKILSNYIEIHGEGKWRTLPQKAGLNRCGKSCRLRWMNYLRPGIKRGNISPEEEDLIIRLHRLLGNRWSLIAGRLPGRTDNEIKNYWNSVLSKRLKGDVPKPSSNKQCQYDHRKKSVEKYRLSSSASNVIAPKATRCTKILSLDEGKVLMNNVQNCPPSSYSTPPDFDDESTSESKKDNEVQMAKALDYLELSPTRMEKIFEKSNMLESDMLEPMFESGFDNLTSLLGFEDEYWRDLL